MLRNDHPTFERIVARHRRLRGARFALRGIRRWLALSAFLPVACGSPGSVAVTATISSPDIAVDASSVLAARLTGTFLLHLELGQHASSATDVSVGQGNLTLRDGASQASLVLLKFTTTPTAPYHLDPGGKLDVTFTIADRADTSGQLLTKDEETAICAARMAAQIAGSISDSGGLVAVNSTTFAIRCP
jgi:hypothetical protein